MKRFLYFLLAASMLFAFGCTGDTSINSNATASDTYAGVLTDATTGNPIVGATLYAGANTVVTDANGAFNLGVLASGSGNIGDSAQVLINLTKATSAGTTASYPKTVVRTVNALGNGGTLAFTVGQLTATITGVITSSGSQYPAAGAQVNLLYVVGGFAAAPTATTDANGIFTFTHVEAGGWFYVTAASADGLNSATSNNFTAPVTGSAALTIPASQLVLTPYDQNAVLSTAGTSITVGTTTVPVTAFGVNIADFAAGATTVTYKFSKPVVASGYTGAFGTAAAVGSPLWNDVFVNVQAKGGNVANYAVEFVDSKTLTVSFTTVASSIYTVDINTVVPKLVDAAGNTFTIQGGNSAVIFGTSGAAPITVAPIAAQGTLKTAASDLTVNITPQVGVASYHIYVQQVINGVAGAFLLGTTNGVDAVKYPAGAFTLDGTAFFPGWAYLSGQSPPVVPLDSSYFSGLNQSTAFYNGITPITYNVNVVALNADGVEGASTTVAIVDNTAPFVTNNLWNSGSFAAANIALPALVTTGTPVVLSGKFATAANELQFTVYFSEQMNKTLVEDKTKWGITGSSYVGATTTVTPVSTITVAAGGGTLAVGTAVTTSLDLTDLAITYNYPATPGSSITATVKGVNVNYSVTAPAADPIGAAYTISTIAPPNYNLNPFAGTVGNFLFTYSTLPTDIKGNALAYQLPAAAASQPSLGF